MSDLGGLDLHGDDLEEIKRVALRRHTAGANPSVQADGVAALGVASSMLLGLLARKRGRALGDMTATMLSSATHALMDRNSDYANRPEPPVSDPDMYGLAPCTACTRRRMAGSSSPHRGISSGTAWSRR